MTKDQLKQRELFIISKLRKGYSPKYVIAKVVEEFDVAEATATNAVYEINSQLNKGLSQLTDEAANYIYNVLINTIDDTIDDNDRKSRLKALELLAKMTNVGDNRENKVDVNVNFGFSYGEDN